MQIKYNQRPVLIKLMVATHDQAMLAGSYKLARLIAGVAAKLHNGTQLTRIDAIVLRCCIKTFAADLQECCGDDEDCIARRIKQLLMPM